MDLEKQKINLIIKEGKTKMRRLFQSLGPKWSKRRVPTASGVDILGMWQLSEIPGDVYLAVGHYVQVSDILGIEPSFNGWYDGLGVYISADDPIRWAPIPE